jgi:nucleoside-diphosphate-sugar epimerase
LAFKDMATKIAAAAGIDFVEWPKDRYFVETGDYISDIARIKDRLNWKPLVSIDEGIARTVEYYREHGKMYWDAG